MKWFKDNIANLLSATGLFVMFWGLMLVYVPFGIANKNPTRHSTEPVQKVAQTG